jgi:purine-nucleoside phosphorylase
MKPTRGLTDRILASQPAARPSIQTLGEILDVGPYRHLRHAHCLRRPLRSKKRGHVSDKRTHPQKTQPCQATAITEAAEYLRERTRHTHFDLGMILGSGLSSLAEEVVDADIIPFTDIPHFCTSTVTGHAGQLVLGRIGQATVWMMQGRLHYYEGYTLSQVTFPVRVMQRMDIDTLIITNAAGGIHANFRAGDLMLITDHLNLVGMMGHHPLRGPNDDLLGPRFPSMARTYDARLAELARAVAQEQDIVLREGIYVMVSGPSFETPAEVRFLRLIGADAVGMSTVPEVVVACHGGMRVLGLSLISNVAIDTLPEDPDIETSHQEVLEMGRRAAPKMAMLLRGIIGRIIQE